MNKPSRSLSDLSPAQLQLLVVELRRKLAAQNAPAGAEPIAIIGMTGRYPGTDGSLESFWDLMAQKRSAIRSAAEGRGPRDLFGDADEHVLDGAYLDDLDAFDAGAFGVSDSEARHMDPQLRLLLETGWEAMERAGLAGERRIEATGVFLGICTIDFANVLQHSGERWEGHMALGNSHGLIAGRLSRQFGLTGPSAAYNSACASSLVAAYEACRALQRRDCDAALVCGVNTVLSDLLNRDLAALDIISPTGRCCPFDADADGYVRGEGCGVLVLRRLSDAKAAGDIILAEIRGLGMTHDGVGQQMTPSRPAQVRAMKRALTEAGVSPGSVGYVEAGSIGAPLADAIEGAALAEVFGGDRKVPLRIGTLKPLIGHLEGAAGVAALTRAAMCLSRRTLLPHGGFIRSNPHMDWCDGALTIESAPRPIEPEAPLLSVNTSSLSGTNVHLVLAPHEAAPRESTSAAGPVALLLSARSVEGLVAIASAAAARIAADPAALPDLAATFVSARSRLPHRAACVVDDPSEAGARLADAVAAPGLAPTTAPRLALVFGPDPLPPVPGKAAEVETAALTAWEALGTPLSPAVRRLARAIGATAHLRHLGLRPAATGGDPLAAAHAAGLITADDALALLHAHETGSAVPPVRPGRADCPIYAPLPLPDRSLTSACLLQALTAPAAPPGFPEDVCVLGLGAPAPITLSDTGGWPGAIARLFLAGLPLDGRAMAADIGGRLTDAPVAGFDRRRYWPDVPDSAAPMAARPAATSGHVALSADAARAILDAILRDELGLSDYDGSTNLTDVGASSIEVMRAMLRIKDELGFSPDADRFLIEPTLNGLIAQYRDRDLPSAAPPLSNIEEGRI